MHGFNQGSELLKSYCANSSVDFLLIQEHWLSPDALHKIDDIAQDYFCFSVSSMTAVLESGPLRGRPFGGLSILVKNMHRQFCSVVALNERYIAVQYNDILIIDVYFPCVSSLNHKDETIDLLVQLDTLVNQSVVKDIIIGGDFNCNLEIESWSSKVICDFMEDNSLSSCNKLAVNVIGAEYTYSNELLGHYSYLDYFVVSNSLTSSVMSLEICSDDFNLSDHSPVCIEVCNIISDCETTVLCSNKGGKSTKIPDTCYQNRWDHADIVAYYELTRLGLQPILAYLNDCSNSFPPQSAIDYKRYMRACIDLAYNDAVSVLVDAAKNTVPRFKANALKHWWDQELSELKEKAFASHKLWIEAGKPRNGYIFDIRKADKYKYKCLIKRKQLEVRDSITNDLHDALLLKDADHFWKVWKSKFPAKRPNKYALIEGNSDPNIISNTFCNYFSEICTAHPSVNASSNNIFLNRFDGYIGDLNQSTKNIISIDLIEDFILSMKRGKAAGLDSLTIEHIQFAHPAIICILKLLFNYMLEFGIVPEGFRNGLVIPLPKEDSIKKNVKLENFRCITISPVISKIFEHCLMRLFAKYLNSDDAQLGFKKKCGCSHAIYCVKQVVDYYVRGGSTVNVCTLDISKAFDKVNLFVLLCKLMDRNIPNYVINVLYDWFSNNYITVKWLNILSSRCPVNSGVRQGGVLSPVLFAIYVDDILVKLRKSRLGCTIQGLSVNAYMYADDLIILSGSVTDLQKLITLSIEELKCIHLSINPKKCFCMRVGKRFKVNCNNVVVDNYSIQWSSEIRYLGVYLTAGHVLKFNLDYGKKKFYRCLNSIMSKTGNKAIDIVLSLTQSYCIPILLYAVESMCLTTTERQRLGSSFNKLYNKLFSTFDTQTIAYCQYYTGYLPLDYVIDLRCWNFLQKLSISNNLVLNKLFRLNGNNTIDSLCLKYNCEFKNYPSLKVSMWEKFKAIRV
jgi:exonuclease III